MAEAGSAEHAGEPEQLHPHLEPEPAGSATPSAGDDDRATTDRASPASSVCYMGSAELGSGPVHRFSTPSNDGSQADVEDDGDHTPRSEVPSNADSTSGDVGYFSPAPLRYFSSRMNVSNTSIDNATTATRALLQARDSPDPAERPHIARDHLSSSSAYSTATVRPTGELSGHRAREPPTYPNQAYSALQIQQHSLPRMRGMPPGLGSRSANTIQTLSHHHPHYEAGSRTVGHSPASSPGLYSPNSLAHRPIDPTEDSGSYSSPYLHFTHRQAPKETHVADVDVDPVTGRKLINRYEVIDELGRGVHGKVKLGRNIDTGSYVAIKIVERYSKRKRLGKNGSHEDKIKKEIAILKKARHPNIVGLLEVIDDPQRRKVYIVLEHVEMGEVRWRTEGADEIVLVDYRRYQRESVGVFENDAAQLEDQKILHEAAIRRERQQRLMAQRRRRKGDDHAWSFEHGGGTDDEESESERPERAFATAVLGPSHDSDPLDPERTAEAPFPPRPLSRVDTASRQRSEDLGSTGLEGTMYGAYEPEIPRGRTPSIGSSLHSYSLDSLDSHDVPENFRYVPLMTLSTARAVFRDTVLGLEYLHYQGVIHRDIKPANLLQAKNHHVKISDFGVSFLGKPASVPLNEDQSESEAPETDAAIELAKTVGTPAFYAPELCRSGSDDEDDDPPPVGPAIDIWSLGITLYCFIFGRVPFHDTDLFRVMREIAEEPVYIPRFRLKAVDDRSSSRPNSRSRIYLPTNSNKRDPHELVYEPVSDELHDLLRRLFIKDPRKRISLAEVKHHPWVLGDISDPRGWLDETDPSRQTQGRKIEVSNEDVAEAVVPYHLVLERVRSSLRRIGGGIQGALGIGRSGISRKRAKSSAALDDGNSSANSSSSAVSHDGRRASLRVDDQILSALRAPPRDGVEHPLSQSVTASPEMKDQSHYFTGPVSASSRTGSPSVATQAEFAPAQLTYMERVDASMSTATSARTIRPTDLERAARYRFPIMSTPATPTVPENPTVSPGGTGFSNFIGGARRMMRSVRSRDRSLGRPKSTQSLNGSDDDTTHAEPSVALSNTTVAGHVDLPASLMGGSPSLSARPSPSSTRTHSMASPDHLRPRDTGSSLSRHSSLSSVSSSHDLMNPPSAKDVFHAGYDFPHPPRSVAHSFSSSESMEDRYQRYQAARRGSRPLSGLYMPPMVASQVDRHSPSYEEDSYRSSHVEEDSALRTQILDRSTAVEPSPPTSQTSTASKPITSSSSEDQLHSGMSQSTSNPSIPSVMSANSSIVTDGGMADSITDSKGDSSESGETLNNPAVVVSGEPTPDHGRENVDPFDSYDRSFEGDHAPESCADDEGEDESDSDDLTIDFGRHRSRSQAGPRSESISSVSRVRTRPSVRPLRSGSNGTVKKIRRADPGPDDPGEPSEGV